MSGYIVRDLGPLATVTSSGGAAVSNTFGHLDDAEAITIFFTSSALSSAAAVQVSMFDPADTFPQGGVTQSSAWFTLANSATSAGAIQISPAAFRGLRLSITATSSGKGEVIAWAVKQIFV